MSVLQEGLPLLTPTTSNEVIYRGDHLLVAGMIPSGSKVLDVGCGDGDLLQLLETRGIDGRG
ncbi:MAG: methionine biosynthesis protein MetW, partial [Tardiphaga sp.]